MKVKIAVGVVLMMALFATAFAQEKESKAPIGTHVHEGFTILTPDKYPIYGDYFFPKDSMRPTVILLHQLSKDRFSWREFGLKLSGADLNYVWYDARGHGFSIKGQVVIEQGKPKILDDAGSWKYFASTGENNDWNKMTDDLGLIMEHMKKNEDYKKVFDPKQVILVGASIGANTALKYAAKEKEIKGIVLLSPGLNYHDIKAEPPAKDWDGRPCLIVCSKGDSYSLSSCRELKEIMDKAAGKDKSKVKLEILDGDAHGTNMLGDELDKKIIDWIKETIKK